jgi:hypothetical protein
MSDYHAVHPELDPEQMEQLPNGLWRQEIELILTDDPDRPSWRALEPAVCAIDSVQARKLALELDLLATIAEQYEERENAR